MPKSRIGLRRIAIYENHQSSQTIFSQIRPRGTEGQMIMKRNSWRTLGARSIYRDPFIRVRVDRVIRPDGTKGTYSVVELKGGIGVVVRDVKGRILLVGQSRYAIGRYSWEIPKGAFEKFGHTESPPTASIFFPRACCVRALPLLKDQKTSKYIGYLKKPSGPWSAAVRSLTQPPSQRSH